MSHCIGLAAILERKGRERRSFGLVEVVSTEERGCLERWLVERRAEM
jgi:hypothetical protein